MEASILKDKKKICSSVYTQFIIKGLVTIELYRAARSTDPESESCWLHQHLRLKHISIIVNHLLLRMTSKSEGCSRFLGFRSIQPPSFSRSPDSSNQDTKGVDQGKLTEQTAHGWVAKGEAFTRLQGKQGFM